MRAFVDPDTNKETYDLSEDTTDTRFSDAQVVSGQLIMSATDGEVSGVGSEGEDVNSNNDDNPRSPKRARTSPPAQEDSEPVHSDTEIDLNSCSDDEADEPEKDIVREVVQDNPTVQKVDSDDDSDDDDADDDVDSDNVDEFDDSDDADESEGSAAATDDDDAKSTKSFLF